MTVFGREDEPVTVGLVIDGSVSMREVRDLVIAGGTAFARAGNPRDQFFALAFNETVRSALPADLRFTSDPEVLRQALQSAITARGRTALFDAIGEGLDYAARGAHLRKALVVVSDGADNASRTTFDQALVRLQSSNVVVYSVALVDELNHDASPARLRRMAEGSGGDAFRPTSAKQTAAAFDQIARELRRSYTLAYTPTSALDGRFHGLAVKVVGPGRSGLSVRVRSGYMAEWDPGGTTR